MPGYNDNCYDQPCVACEKHPEDCECPACLKCGFVGSPDCYRFHGLKPISEDEKTEAEKEPQ
jgi:hypothetical protein